MRKTSYRSYLKVTNARKTIQETQQQILKRIEGSGHQYTSVMKILDGVVDVGMRNGEMRRILAHDPDIAKALDKIQADQSKIEEQLRESRQENPPKSPGTSESGIPRKDNVVTDTIATAPSSENS